MQSALRWESIWLNIFLGIFVWQLFDTMIDIFEVNQTNQIILYISGIIITSYIIYGDRYFKGN